MKLEATISGNVLTVEYDDAGQDLLIKAGILSAAKMVEDQEKIAELEQQVADLKKEIKKLKKELKDAN